MDLEVVAKAVDSAAVAKVAAKAVVDSAAVDLVVGLAEVGSAVCDPHTLLFIRYLVISGEDPIHLGEPRVAFFAELF